ncbi:FAD-binding domain-containing protein [Rhodovulum adriaticum]|uniref:Deoxyribodipyrimidine photo-lyase family protein (Cryptochrome) n=1 Tax=Rhodovulum adriaticum TaxID=35804 RepID=A0A4R2NXX1_RHOAD|nr:FAD-binding domain-containing protein [Rhodovulum adriaticum]MBK1636275.1 deoxyribodipyrimidine photolyase [Rhodovulum adriaticum]TCP26275.1 deoxyribodipyrimidine photo-lyase family protein (cryptochrome) [Rhodovulum adriaticum]
MDVTILWFKRDLRVADHPALAHAAAGEGAVLPLYIVEPGYWALPDTSARQWRFTAECLGALSDELVALGAPLQVELGEAVSVLDRLADRWPVTRIVSHEETGNAWTYARDRAVAIWARGRGIAWVELAQSGVVRRLAGRDGWAARRDRFMRAPQVEAPAALRGLAGTMPGTPPEARDLRLAFDPCPGRQKGGRAAGLDLLDSFLTARGQDYRRAMSSPMAGATACSRLSPHIALGSLSLREVEQATAASRRAVAGAGDGWAGSLKSFSSRLAWRDHFMQKLEDEPTLEHRCLHSAYEGLRPHAPDAARLAAWQRGETGLPFVDACMRSLIHTGWLNFRMRSMLVAVASYHLWLDWRATGPYLARMFTDYEPGIHWPQMQMQSGTTGMNTIRIYNPVKQGYDQDPTGAFTRKWLPELAEVPDAFLHEPWRWQGGRRLLGRRYPAPVVDVAAAARAARVAVWGVRERAGFGDEAARVIARHASRKDRAGRFVNDRAPRPRRGDARQLRLDL